MNWTFDHKLEKKEFKDHENITLSYLIFEKEQIAKEYLNLETLREIHFKYCKISNSSFENSFFGKVKLENCELTNVTFSDCNLTNVIFDNCKLMNVTFFESEMNDCHITESLIEYSILENNKINNSILEDVKLRENIHRHNKYEATGFYKCELMNENFIDTKFKNCDLKTSHFQETNIDLNDLISSKLSILNLLEIVNSKGIIIEE